MQGSVEVLSEMLPKLSTDQVKLKIIGSGVGAVTENDVLLASASGAIVIAFGIRPDRKAADLAQQEHVDIRTHTIIYEVSDELKKAMEGLLEPVVTEDYLGRAEVRNTFRVKGTGTSRRMLRPRRRAQARRTDSRVARRRGGVHLQAQLA